MNIYLVRVTTDEREHRVWAAATSRETAVDRVLDQVPEAELGSRIRLSVHPGGHMFYTNDASRAALHDEASGLFGRR